MVAVFESSNIETVIVLPVVLISEGTFTILFIICSNIQHSFHINNAIRPKGYALGVW